MKRNIAVFGLGYVGLASATLLSKKHDVAAVDLDDDKVRKINARISPIADVDISKSFDADDLSLRATSSAKEALVDAEFAIIATPTDYNPEDNYFNTDSVISVLSAIDRYSPQTVAVIKSTIPIGFTADVQSRFPRVRILFSPEFLREGRALYDNLYPDRIIVSGHEATARDFANILADSAAQVDTPILICRTEEAEAAKLFANSYLALRVAFFNELDNFARVKGLSSEAIIRGVSYDERIGGHYNNPSFGYGGYCLPKDTKQLLANFEGVPQNLIKAIVDSNQTRIKFIVDDILRQKPTTVGIYKLAMKSGSDNFRSAAITQVLLGLQEAGVRTVIHEPGLRESPFEGVTLVSSFNDFLRDADLVIANRVTEELRSAKGKVYSRDVFGDN